MGSAEPRSLFLCDNEAHLRKEDQQRINTFSKLNNRLSDIQDQLKVKQVS